MTYDHEAGHSSTSCHRIAKYVGIHTTDDGNRAGGIDTTDQTKHQEGGPVGGQGACHCEDGKDDEGGKHDDSSAIAFAQRPEEQWAEDIANKEERYGQHELLFVGHVKDRSDEVDGSTGEGGSQCAVDDGCNTGGEDEAFAGLPNISISACVGLSDLVIIQLASCKGSRDLRPQMIRWFCHGDLIVRGWHCVICARSRIELFRYCCHRHLVLPAMSFCWAVV